MENTDWELMIAARDGDIDTLKNYIIGDIPEKDIRNISTIAAKQGHLNIIQYLVENGIDINISTYEGSMLTLASKLGHCDIIDYLLSKNADVNHKDYENHTPLAVACYTGNIDVIDRLLATNKCEIDVRIGYHPDITPLMLAIRYEHLDVVDRLLAYGADYNKLDNYQRSCLFFALEPKNNLMLKKILDLGINVNHTNFQGDTPLTDFHYAHGFDRQTIEILLQNGADVNWIGYWGKPILHSMCSLKGQCKIDDVKILLDAGADPRIKDSENKTCFDYELSDEIQKLLLEYCPILN